MSGTPDAAGQASEEPTPAHEPAPAAEPAPASTTAPAPKPAAAPAAKSAVAPASVAPAGAAPAAVGGEEELLKATQRLIGDNAPWRRGIPWAVILVQGAVLAICGALLWLAPGWGTSAVLRFLSLLLLVTAGLSAWRLLRRKVPVENVGPVAFRAGVGLTVGLVVLVSGFVIEDTASAGVAFAIVLGVGLLLYGLSVGSSAFAQRVPGAFPVAPLIVAALVVVVGLLLVINGRNGAAALQSSFAVLGILLLVAGLGLVVYAFMLRSRQQPAPLAA